MNGIDLSSLSTISVVKGLLTSKPFSLSEVKNSIDAVIAREDLMSGKLHKHFFYEICPLNALASHLSATHLSFSGEDHSFDGEIFFSKGTSQKVECVRGGGLFGTNKPLPKQESPSDQSIGKKRYFINERHRMDHLELYGRAPAFEFINVERKGDKITKEQLALAQWVNLSPKKRALYCNLTRAFCGKYDPKYQGLWLVITFDDRYPPLRGDLGKFLPSVLRFWEKVKKNNIFERIFIIGESLPFPIFWDSIQPNSFSYLNK